MGAVPSFSSNFPRGWLSGEILPFVFSWSSVVGVMSDERTPHYFRGERMDMNGAMLSTYGSRSSSYEAGKRYNAPRDMDMKAEGSRNPALPVDGGSISRPLTESANCAACQKPIRERYLLKALDQFWHEDCLKCACCDCRLGEVGSTLFTKANLILCKRDYLSFPTPLRQQGLTEEFFQGERVGPGLKVHHSRIMLQYAVQHILLILLIFGNKKTQ
ncbi:rhombotin-1 [Trichonephila clavipes]|nr:rhombotin-1 [Trichonephila clavipes]